jgi:hypothetical protein
MLKTIQDRYRFICLFEAANSIGVTGEGFRQSLQDNVAAEARAARPIDLAHTIRA